MPLAYYNEFDQFAAAWLRELIKGGHIAPGDVDERSISEVQPEDVRGYTQAHFFAGIGGWSYALRLAGWDDARPVWTGSCPCQPFSSAGKGEGGADDRHLWPYWARLIGECRPVAVFGEQVESAIAHGWLDAVFDDLEREGYACGAACVPAASVGAPHIRQRVWFVGELGIPEGRDQRRHTGDARSSTDASGGKAWSAHGHAVGSASELGNTEGIGWQRRSNDEDGWRRQRAHRHTGSVDWRSADWLPCRDGKARPVEPGTFPLAHGIQARVGRLRGYGNAIVPQVAAEVIGAYLASLPSDASAARHEEK
jgi:DNA (cytosine-5)-methyltransferase 1